MKQKIIEEMAVILEIGIVEEMTGNVCIAVVDGYGEAVPGGYLFSFTKDGRILRHPEVKTGFGFQLNEQGQIKVKNSIFN